MFGIQKAKYYISPHIAIKEFATVKKAVFKETGKLVVVTKIRMDRERNTTIYYKEVTPKFGVCKELSLARKHLNNAAIMIGD